MIRNVVFDIGGVLLEWDPRAVFRQLVDDEAEIDRLLGEVLNRASRSAAPVKWCAPNPAASAPRSGSSTDRVDLPTTRRQARLITTTGISLSVRAW